MVNSRVWSSCCCSSSGYKPCNKKCLQFWKIVSVGCSRDEFNAVAFNNDEEYVVYWHIWRKPQFPKFFHSFP